MVGILEVYSANLAGSVNMKKSVSSINSRCFLLISKLSSEW